jgi:sarcosine oxidase gamma subunit
MVNDEDRPRKGTLRLSFTDAAGKETAAGEVSFSLLPLGADSYLFSIKSPETPGAYSLQAVATPADDSTHPTISHRDVTLELSPSQK